MVLYAQLRTRPSFSRRETGGGSFIDPGQRPVSWIYCSAVRIVGLRAPTTDDPIHVAGAVLLACRWRWQYVVAAAFLHGLRVAFEYISSTANSYEILRDGCDIFHRYVGEIFRLLRRSRWSRHVPEKYLPVIDAALLRLLLTLVMVLCIGAALYLLLLLLPLLLLCWIADLLLKSFLYAGGVLCVIKKRLYSATC